MSELDLRKLHQLHLIDLAIHEIKKRAAALDPGRAIQAHIDRLQAELDDKGGVAKALSQELKDLELKQKGIDDKLKKIDAELYSGKVVSSREIESLEKEVVILKRQRGEIDERLLELWELVPPAKTLAETIEKAIAAKKVELGEFQKQVMVAKSQLEAEFKAKSAQRPVAAKEVPPLLLSRYDAIRQKAAGVGMADIDRNGYCGMCGTHLPEKLIESARVGRVALCESCHRILYISDGLL